MDIGRLRGNDRIRRGTDWHDFFHVALRLASKKSKSAGLRPARTVPLTRSSNSFCTNISHHRIFSRSWDLSGYPAARGMALVANHLGHWHLRPVLSDRRVRTARYSLYAVLADTRRVWKLAVVVTIVLVK